MNRMENMTNLDKIENEDFREGQKCLSDTSVDDTMMQFKMRTKLDILCKKK
jgi:hypothetical protein